MASSDRLAQILRARADLGADFGSAFGLSDDRADAFNWLIGLLNGDEPEDLSGGSPIYRFAAPVRLTTFDGVDEEGATYTDELTGRDAPSSLVRGQHGKHLEVEKSGGGFVTMMHDEGIYIGEDVPLIGDVEITGDLLADQDAEIVGSLTVDVNADILGNETVGGTLGVTAATTLQSTLGVTGATTLQSTLHVVGATTLDATLGVTGITTLTDALIAKGAVTLGDNASDVITVTGTMTVAENLTLSKGLIVDTTTLVVDAVNNKVGVGAVPASTDAMLSVAGYIATTGVGGTPTTNANQVFLLYNTGVSAGILRSLNPGTSTYLALVADGLTVDLRASNVSRVKVSATGVGFNATAPVAPAALTGSAAAVYDATTRTLINDIKALLQGNGLAT